jgi:hypothetical protein
MMLQQHTLPVGQRMPPRPAIVWHGSAAGPGCACPDFPHLLGQFQPISLADMDHVVLLDRIDTKYVLHVRQLYSALAALTEHYRVLEIGAIRLHRYQTLYFDTVSFALYLDHHAGKRNRYKVRSRSYVDTQLAFLEVKFKTHKNRTIKSRIQTLGLVARFTPQTREFLSAHCSLSSQLLEPKLWNDFWRITMVSKQHQERLTLDLHLGFCNDRQEVGLPNIAIAEVKQDGMNCGSAFMRQMRTMNIHPRRFSKYCMGVTTLYQYVKHNNFKPELRLVNKLMRGDYHVQ